MTVMVIGAGAVGSAAAFEIARRARVHVLLYDIESERARGRAMDITQAIERPRSLEHCPDLNRLPEADLIVVTAGIARQKGMTRADLASGNALIVSNTGKSIAELAPDTPTLVVTNPSEPLVNMLHLLEAKLNVFGFGCSLDQWRLRHFIAEALHCDARRVRAIVMGMHSDAMISLTRLASVDGIPLTDLLPEDEIAALESRTKTAGTDIVNALGNHSGFVAAGQAIATLVEAFLAGDGGVYPLSVMASGRFGMDEVCLALPTAIRTGSLRPLDIQLTADEIERLRVCAERVRTTTEAAVEAARGGEVVVQPATGP